MGFYIFHILYSSLNTPHAPSEGVACRLSKFLLRDWIEIFRSFGSALHITKLLIRHWRIFSQAPSDI